MNKKMIYIVVWQRYEFMDFEMAFYKKEDAEKFIEDKAKGNAEYKKELYIQRVEVK